MIEPKHGRTGGRKNDDRARGRVEPYLRCGSRGGDPTRESDAAMEMTQRWKSQNDFHSCLEISLENARFPHSHSRSSLCQMRREDRRTSATRSTTSHTQKF